MFSRFPGPWVWFRECLKTVFDVLYVSIYVAVPLLLVHLSWDPELLWDSLTNWYSSGGFYDRTLKKRKIIKIISSDNYILLFGLRLFLID